MKLAIFGMGGAAKDCLEVAMAMERERQKLGLFGVGQIEFVGFLVDPPYRPPGTSSCLGGMEFLAQHPQVMVVVGVGDPSSRKLIVERIQEIAYGRFATLIHPAAQIAHGAHVGEGSVICAGVTVSVDAKVGAHAHLVHKASIGHDALTGSYLTMGASATLGGGVRLGDRVLLGQNANVIPGRTVAHRTVIGAGSVVLTHITEPGKTWVGIPARPLEREF